MARAFDRRDRRERPQRTQSGRYGAILKFRFSARKNARGIGYNRRNWKGASLAMKLLNVNLLVFCPSLLLLAMGLMIAPSLAFAQHGGGGHGAPLGTGGISGPTGRPDGPDDKDSLKDFHHAMEVQATSDQAAAFRAILKSTEAANTQLASLGQEKDAAAWAGRA